MISVPVPPDSCTQLIWLDNTYVRCGAPVDLDEHLTRQVYTLADIYRCTRCDAIYNVKRGS